MPRRFDQDEGPTDEDLDRFGGEAERSTGFCPHCGAELSDLADICPKCHSWIPEGVQRHPPIVRELVRRWYAFIGILILIVFLYLYLFSGPH